MVRLNTLTLQHIRIGHRLIRDKAAPCPVCTQSLAQTRLQLRRLLYRLSAIDTDRWIHIVHTLYVQAEISVSESHKSDS